MDAYYADWAVECWKDFMMSMAKVMQGPAEEKEENLKNALAFLDKYFEQLEVRFKTHGCEYVTGKNMSMADFTQLCLYANIATNSLNPFKDPILSIFDKYPCVKANAEKMATCMKTYLEKRPKRMA